MNMKIGYDVSMTLTAILCSPGEDARIVEIEPGLEPLQKAVGGYIGEVRLAEGIIGYVNDDGLLVGLPWNRQLGPKTFVAGTMIVLGYDEAGEGRGLTSDEQRQMLGLLNGVPRLNHTKASSIRELESWISEKAVRFYSGKNGEEMVERCTKCGEELAPECKGFCPKCTETGSEQ
jgi:hypothetical protein